MSPFEWRTAPNVTTGAPPDYFAQVASVHAMAGTDGAHVLERECLSGLDILHHKQRPSKRSTGLFHPAHAIMNVANGLLDGADRFHHHPELVRLQRERRVRPGTAARKREMLLHDARPE